MQEFFTKIALDSDFREMLKKDPKSVLTAAGLESYENKTVMVFENTKNTIHFSLLKKGTDLEDFEGMDERFIEVQKRAWEDDAFKAELISNTRSALMEIFGQIPEALDIRIHENTDNKINIILPFLDTNDTDELDDSDLEMVAGGKGGSRRRSSVASVFNSAVNTVTRTANQAANTVSHGAQQGWNFYRNSVMPVQHDVLQQGKNAITGPMQQGRDWAKPGRDAYYGFMDNVFSGW